MRYNCPVCGFPNLKKPHRDKYGCPTHEICPCCGVEFGYDDASKSYSELQVEWIKKGSPWFSKEVKKPKNWHALTQLKKAGLSLNK